MTNRFSAKNMMVTAALVLLTLAVVRGGNIAAAQEANRIEGAEQYLLKPERIAEACPMPIFPVELDPATKGRGAVVVLMSINTSGLVFEYSIRRENPKGYRFADAVNAVIGDWQYKPAYWGGKPVVYNIAETFYFENGTVRLKEKKSQASTKPTPTVEVKQ